MSASVTAATIYIPRILSYFTECDIANIFGNFEIGFVSRVDFNAIGKKPGFKEEEENNVRAAFVHINYFYNSKLGDKVQEALNQEKEYRLQINNNSYWILLKTITPVKATNMNIHQIVDNCRYLEGIVEQQQKQINELTKLVSNIQSEVYQLLGGLFNQETQSASLKYSIATLHNQEVNVNELGQNTSKWGIWHTTRQGDYLEKQVEKIMEKLNISDGDSESENIKDVYKRKLQEHLDILLGQKRAYESDSDSDNDDNSNSNSDSANESERVKNSSTLCGNE